MLNSVALLFTLCCLFTCRVTLKSIRILEISTQNFKWYCDQDVPENYLCINNMASDQALTYFNSRRDGHRLHVKNLEEVNITLDSDLKKRQDRSWML